MKEKITSGFFILLRGMGMGVADIIPGVSGGTIAFITGIYQKLVESIKSINYDFIKLVLKGKIRNAWFSINGNFLLTVFTGILLSVFSLARLISWLLEHHQMLVWAFFFGLIVASAIYIGKKIEKWSIFTIMFLFVGTAFSYYITIATPATTPDTLLNVFLSGCIAICAMILPGISGSFILLLIGKYEYVLNAVRDLNAEVLGVFALGCVIGIILFSNVISWLLKKYYSLTMATLTGLMIGALNKLWPWKKVVETTINRHGEEISVVEKSITPQQFQQICESNDPMIAQVILLMIAGFGLIFFVNFLASLKKN